jgi:hypothetical protein
MPTHTVTSDTGAPVTFDSGALGSGGTFTFTFANPGTVNAAPEHRDDRQGLRAVDPPLAPATAVATADPPKECQSFGPRADRFGLRAAVRTG